MEKMKQEITKKLNYWRKMCALFTILLLTHIWDSIRPIDINATVEFTDFFQGFQFGIIIAILFFTYRNIYICSKTLKDEEAIKDFYIKQHDERTAAIEAKSGGTVLGTCGTLIIGASIIAGYFNPIVFATLLICGVFLLLVKKGLGIYYCKKM